MDLPRDKAEYATREYWDRRFQAEPQYDWLASFEAIRAQLLALPAFADKQARILVLGCGNSSLSSELHAMGYTRLLSTDYSEVVLANNRGRWPDLAWQFADMNDLSALPGPFDIVIDKGALDAVVAREEDVWDPQPDLRAEVRNILEQVRKVLVPGGLYLQVSFQQPHFRNKYLGMLGWSHRVEPVGAGLGYFLYVIQN
jgi:SAM-dependent methyltransferase